MKAKKHEGGGVSAAVNNVKEDMQKAKKDSTKTTFNDGRDKNLLKTSPKTYDKAKQKIVIFCQVKKYFVLRRENEHKSYIVCIAFISIK